MVLKLRIISAGDFDGLRELRRGESGSGQGFSTKAAQH